MIVMLHEKATVTHRKRGKSNFYVQLIKLHLNIIAKCFSEGKQTMKMNYFSRSNVCLSAHLLPDSLCEISRKKMTSMNPDE